MTAFLFQSSTFSVKVVTPVIALPNNSIGIIKPFMVLLKYSWAVPVIGASSRIP